ncbi:MAG: hypothetical protein H7A21_07160 [Spirochaetales bacterium]|nr:hypothetical protein [Leptospiraceae bacterium]MCP5481192.1 hypothetical protein [Spirochaetales bacterium]
MSLSHPILRGVLAAALVGVLASPLLAERRSYESAQPVGQTVAGVIDALAAAGVQFRVEQVFNEQRDGKLGFSAAMLPSGAICELSFHADPGNASRTLIKVFTQEASDGRRIHAVLVDRLHMREVGVYEIPETGTEWPTR